MSFNLCGTANFTGFSKDFFIAQSITNRAMGLVSFGILGVPYLQRFLAYKSSATIAQPRCVIFFSGFASSILATLVVVTGLTSGEGEIKSLVPVEIGEWFNDFAYSTYSLVFHTINISRYTLLWNHFEGNA